ncbi:MAG: hypothetical protein KTR31_37475 [Myxococcales bacterium]|nr:hypothetical protein [Myxococcales bacterium]
MIGWVGVVLLGCGNSTDRLGGGTADPISVLFAARELPAGQPIRADGLHVQLVRPHDVPHTAISEPSDAIGRIPRHRVLPHEPLRRDQLVDASEPRGVSDVIGPGMRAVSVPTGALDPTVGGTVDVWWTPPGDPAPCLALANVVVADVDGSQALLVAPAQQALSLLSLARAPSLRLTARRPDDAEPTPEAACSR